MKRLFNPDYLFILYFALFKFVLHLLTNGQYGFHRDELYFMDCGKHLAWGYTDLPPLTPFLGRIAIEIFGETLRSLRFFPALAGALAVFFSGLMVKEMNGNRYAQTLAMIALIIAPVYLVSGTQFQTIPFDQLLWIVTAYLIIRMINSNNPKMLVYIGLTIGIGFLNKYTMVFLVVSIICAFLLSRRIDLLFNKWFAIATGLVLAIFLPNLIWQYTHNFPVLGHMQALSAQIDEDFSMIQFLVEQILIFNPLTLPIWLMGIAWYFSETGKKYRMLVWIFIIPLLIFLFSGAKSYYLSPAYPILFAGGAIYWQKILEVSKIRWLKSAVIAVWVISFLITLPAWLPLLPIEKCKQYGLMDFRYDYREMIGWPDMVATIAKSYGELTVEEQKITTIFTGNYGEAGAVNHYGPQYGLPPATSGIGSYHSWGPAVNAQIYIVIGGYPEDYLQRFFNDVQRVGTIRNIYEIENEEHNQPYYICRGLKRPIAEIWPEWQHF